MKQKSIQHTILPLLLFVLFFSGVNNVHAQNLPFSKGERLKYNIYYQWGIIWKKAAEATLTAQETTYKSNKAYQLRLSARTTPFFDNFLHVRDTLISITSLDLLPLYYAKITHEGSYNGVEDLAYSYDSGKISTRARTFRDKELRVDSTFVHNVSSIFDMLSVFYHIRSMDIARMNKNQVTPLTIVSGSKTFKIKVVYSGVTSIETPDDKTYETYKITIVLESLKKNKVVKEEMQFWMSKDEQKLPILLSAKLPLGTLKAYFQGVE